MKEIEVKVIEIDKKKVIKQLNDFGAKKIGEYEIESIFFDTNKKSLSKNNSLLRLRKKGKNYLTFKKLNESKFAKSAEEIEIEVNDFEKTKELIKNLGFIAKNGDSKKRITYSLNDALIEIDEYKGVPAFIEIEAKNEEKIREIIKLFNFSNSQIKNWGGKELLKYYKNK